METTVQPMYRIIVDLNIPPDEFLKHYQGVALVVNATSRDGRSVQFPTSILQPFITREGIKGAFSIHFDEKHKFQRIERLA